MQASLPQTVAAMRFILACQSCASGQAQGPLSEEDFLARVQEWATTDPTSSRSTPLFIHGLLQTAWRSPMIECDDAATS